MRKWSVMRSLVAGALIGLTEATPLAAVRPRPLRVVWIDDRDLPDPLDDLPLFLLDPTPIESPVAEARAAGPLSLVLSTPAHLMRLFRNRFQAG